jgi:hypothetical protein
MIARAHLLAVLERGASDYVGQVVLPRRRFIDGGPRGRAAIPAGNAGRRDASRSVRVSLNRRGVAHLRGRRAPHTGAPVFLRALVVSERHC